MSDPHVVALHYNLKTNLLFDHPSPVDSVEHDFDLHLEDGRLAITMRTHYASVLEAQGAVEPFLRAWEIRAALDWQLHGQEWRFVFDQPNIIDRQPIPGAVSTAVFGFVTATAKDAASVVITQTDYAPPPQDFIVDADVATLWNRYQGYILGREPLLSMAYFCMSMLEWRAGGSKPAVSAKYYVAYERGRDKRMVKEVWDTLGDIVSERGDEATARKLEKGATGFVPLTGNEEEWVRAVIRRIIVRAGEVAFDAQRQWPVLTMNDFPQL